MPISQGCVRTYWCKMVLLNCKTHKILKIYIFGIIILKYIICNSNINILLLKAGTSGSKLNYFIILNNH